MIKSTATTCDDDFFYFLERIYTHGKLEEKVGYDLVSCDDALFDRISDFNKSEKETLVRFEQFDFYGEIMQVVMYVWKGKETGLTMGLVIDYRDEESVRYATNKLRARVDCL